MNRAVVDTNVILAANSQHPDLSEECVLECITQLVAIMNSGILFVDQGAEIFTEYARKTSPHTGNRVGDVFVKWAMNNQGNPKRCVLVPISRNCEDKYDEFPEPELQEIFDPADRKFVAVAHASGEKPTVIQATDCKWLDWNERLRSVNISVNFICQTDICKFYASKFPNKSIPEF